MVSKKRWQTLFSNAKSVNKPNMSTAYTLGYFVHYQSLKDLGKISLWISLKACPNL